MVDFFSLKQPDMTPGKVIRAFRKNFGFTLADIEKVTDIKESNLSAIENDSRPVGLDVAVRLAAVFGIDPSTILFPQGGMAALAEPELVKIHKEASRLRENKRA